MKVYGQLEKAQLENKSGGPRTSVLGEMVVDTNDDNQAKYSDGSNEQTIKSKEFEKTFTLANNQSSAANVTGLSFSSASVHRAIIHVAGRRRTDSTELDGEGTLTVRYKKDAASWSIDYELFGDRASSLWLGVTFSITAAGQVQYTTHNLAGANYFGELKFDIVKTFSNFSS